jgi:hypothetical protein
MGGHVLMWRVALVLGVGCGRHLNPEWCAQPGHSDPACRTVIDAPAVTATCADDAACPGTACLPAGTCADPDTVLHASPTGTGTACTSAAKCLLATAIGEAMPGRNIIVLDPATYNGAVAIDHDVQIVGRHATLAAATAGAAVTVTNNATAELDFVSITGATSGAGISCTSGTLRAHAVSIAGNQQGIVSACTLTLERSTVNTNSDGALEITAGTIDVHDNFIVNNGNSMLMRVANVSIASGVAGSFAFNTVAYNNAKKTTNPGVDCNAAAVNVDGNLITDNLQKGVFDVDPQVAGACDFARSYTAAGAGGNDVHWVNVTTSDFHLTSASTLVLDTQIVACNARDDVDGEPRPLGSGCDFGADELNPAALRAREPAP